MTAILGVSCYFHDAAAALLRDGVLVAAAEEERFTRLKHDSRFPASAIDFCLAEGGLQSQALDYVVFYEKPLVKLKRIATTTLATVPRSRELFGRALSSWLRERLWIRDTLSKRLGTPPDRILFVDHHLSHAASALFSSPFEESAVVTIDGVGERTTATIGRGSADWMGGGSSLTLESAITFPHSLGLLYSAFTAYLGFEVNEGEYKVMGMARYGEPRFVDEVSRLIEIYNDGSFWLDLDFFSFHHSLKRPFSPRFERLFGAPPRDPHAEFRTAATHPGARGLELEQNQFYADIAASAQHVTEEVVVGLAMEAYRRTGSANLCLAGGVGLNSVANARLLERTPFERLFVPPAPGDSGGALGAALYVEHIVLGRPRRFVMEHAYWGKAFSEEDVIGTLDRDGVDYERLDEDALLDRVAEMLAGGRVVGWFQDRFEWGPRALGNRSILADPRSASMKATVNEKVKFREPFRPFAPSVLEDRAGDFVDPVAAAQHPSRFMLLALPLHESARADVPAVDHFGTARIQTVRREWNPRYHGLVSRFGERTGVPALLNTSFNLRGEAIVTSPADALSTFKRSGLDVLVMGDVLVAKR
ncbi:MAG TPA: carbamoyltransferase [Gaiellaceae bacterium]